MMIIFVFFSFIFFSFVCWSSVVSFIAVCSFYRKTKKFLSLDCFRTAKIVIYLHIICIGVFRDWVQRSFQNKYENYPWTFHLKRFSLSSLIHFVRMYLAIMWVCMYVCLYTTIDCCSIVIMKIGLWEQLIQCIIWREIVFRSGHHPHALHSIFDKNQFHSSFNFWNSEFIVSLMVKVYRIYAQCTLCKQITRFE